MSVPQRQFTLQTTAVPGATNVTLLVAFQIAKKYRWSIPSVERLKQDYGMSQATACRWRAAMRQAWGDS
jgi:hypothetical protein